MKNIKQDIESRKMQQIRKEITINKGALQTHVKATLDGKVVYDAPGHSIVGGIVGELFQAMKSQADAACNTPVLYSLENAMLFTAAETYDGGTKVKLTYNPAYQSYIGTSYRVMIKNSGTALDGNIYDITGGTSSSPYYIYIDTPWNAAYTAAFAGGAAYGVMFYADTYTTRYKDDRTANHYLRLGTDDTAVTIDDYAVNSWGGFPNILSYTTTTTSVLTVDSINNYAQIVHSTTATNATGSSITVKELGLYRTCLNGHYLFARDVLDAPIEITDASSLTVQYTIRAQMDTTSADQGGFTERFMEILRHGLTSDEPIKDLDGTDRSPTSYDRSMIWRAYNLGRNLQWDQDTTNSIESWKLGILLGTGDTTPNVTDYCLETTIEDGDDAGELYYWGGNIVNYTRGVGYHSFDIERIVENATANPITISELGLAVCIYAYGYNNYDNRCKPLYGALISRHTLSAATPDNRITIAAGDFCRITYTIKVEV